ncbi:MAG: hypothetical protein ABIP56_02465 [Dokdonella sp.]
MSKNHLGFSIDAFLLGCWSQTEFNTAAEIAVVIQRIEIVQAGICLGCVGLIFGLMMAIPMVLFGVNAPPSSELSGSSIWSRAEYFYRIPILYGVVSLIVGSLGAATYNLVARVVGGIRINVDQ